MKQLPEIFALKREAQQVLDELWRECMTPAPMTVGMIYEDVDQYTLHFYDRRLYTAIVPINAHGSFRERVRWAVQKCIASELAHEG